MGNGLASELRASTRNRARENESGSHPGYLHRPNELMEQPRYTSVRPGAETSSLRHFVLKTRRSFYQDRLGANTGKVGTRRRLLQATGEVGLCKETSPGSDVFTREYTKATITLDCMVRFEATVVPKRNEAK